jgi:glutathione S-transferase
MSARYLVFSPELSPFGLKLWALLDFAELPYSRLPAEGSRWQNLRIQWAIERGKRRRSIVRHPALDRLDEFPAVPFLVEPGGRIQYDSSAIASWIDAERPTSRGKLFPQEPALDFLATLIDEAFDEVGLYLVHHNRWVMSARTNDAGERLAREMRNSFVLPGMTGRFARWFAARQVRRLPYLFSVAPSGFTVPGLPHSLTPPSRDGLPPTHSLLEAIWRDGLAALEAVLERQAYVLGSGFTVADASVYGQLSMNLSDPSANERMQELAPRVHAWLCGIREGTHGKPQGSLGMAPELRPLVELIGETFVALMQQNEQAYEEALAAGQTRFNEAAFDRGEALYDGRLRGQPFRSVVKTFQVRVWRDLCRQWARLDEGSRRRLAGLGIEGSWFATVPRESRTVRPRSETR